MVFFQKLGPLYDATSWNSVLMLRSGSLKTYLVHTTRGDRGSTVVKVMCYKSKARWLDSRWCHWNFSLT